jgi:hypothetical protein
LAFERHTLSAKNASSQFDAALQDYSMFDGTDDFTHDCGKITGSELAESSGACPPAGHPCCMIPGLTINAGNSHSGSEP